MIRCRMRSSGGTLLRVIEDEAVHHLDGRRMVLQDGRRGLERLEQIRELHGENRFRLRQRHEPHARLEDHAERALRAHHDARHVERLLVADERVEVVAADSPDDLRVAPLDLVREPRRRRADLAIARRLERRPRRLRAGTPRRRAARNGRPIRPTARRPARSRGRSSCRTSPSARRRSCWPSSRRPWPGSPSRYRERSANRAASAPRSTRRARSPARPAPIALQRSLRAADSGTSTCRRSPRSQSPVPPATFPRRASSGDTCACGTA